jgi:hypothetical protein
VNKSLQTANRTITRKEDLLIATMCALVILFSFWLLPDENGLMLSIPGLGLELRLPPTCWSKTILGISCPACGLTRSFAALAHGDFSGAVAFNAMGPVIFALCLLQIPYRLAKNSGIGENKLFVLVGKHGNKIAFFVIFGLTAAWVFKIGTNIMLMHGCCE